MKLTIYAKNMTVSPHVTRRIEKKTERMGRYLLPDTEMQVRLSKEPKRDIRTVEITVPMGNGVILRSEASEPENLFLAIDQALAKMERQIHRHRSKLDKRIRDDAFASRASDVCRGRRCSDGNAGTQLLRVRQRRNRGNQRAVSAQRRKTGLIGAGKLRNL